MSDLSKQLRPASFRSVPFQVNGAGCGAGRRVQVHEYPQRDMPWVEDLGRATREITFDGFLIGADYIDQANRLLAALETAGPGALVHPWLGAMQVSLSAPARVRFDSGLGMATVSMSFVEAGELAFPNPTRSTQASSRRAADGLSTAAVKDFASNFTVDGYQSFVAAAAQGTLASMLGFLNQGQVAQALGTATSTANLILQAAFLQSRPEMLGQTLLNAFGLSGAAGAVAAWSSVVKILTGAATSKSMRPAAPVIATTASRQQININTSAIHGIGRQLLLAQAVGVSSLVGTEQDNAQAGITQTQDVTQQVTQDAMMEVRDTLLWALDDEMRRCGDAAYDAMQQAAADVYADLTARAQGAARLTSWRPPETMPMLAIAYELHADATRDAEILFRNGIRHPGFVPPAPIYVISAGYE